MSRYTGIIWHSPWEMFSFSSTVTGNANEALALLDQGRSDGSWFCQRPGPSRPEVGWARLARVSPSIALGTAINIVKLAQEELQHQQNGKVLRNTLLPLFCTFRLGTGQVEYGGETDTKGKGKWKTEGEAERGRRLVRFETSDPNNQYLTSSQHFCWLKGNMKCLTQRCHPSHISSFFTLSSLSFHP